MTSNSAPATGRSCCEIAPRDFAGASFGLRAPANAYRPNSRSTSQPSRPGAASGRTEVRAGAGLPAALAGEGAFTGVLACEAACTKFEKKPPACKPDKPAIGTPMGSAHEAGPRPRAHSLGRERG